MKILVICQYYSPEPFRHPDICEELQKRGHEVTVVTGLPNYPMGSIYQGYRNGQKRDERINGVKVHRCFTIGRRHGAFFRLLNYESFALSSTHYVKKSRESYDVVLIHQLSPVMMAKAGIAYKKRHHTKVVLYCLDLWPESLVAGGIGRNSVIYRLFHGISERIYRNADTILITSRLFSEYFKEEFNITDTKYLPQYADAVFIPEQCRKVPNDTVDLMFAGNVGTAQSIDTVLRAAELTSDIANLRWHIVGDGSESERLKKMAENSPQVIFHGRQPLSKMPEYYAMADAMLLTLQKDEILSMTLPGKLQTYMAAGKPVVGAIDGEAARVIRDADCGVCGEAENAEALAENVRRFLRMNHARLGKNARAYYDRHFSRQTFIGLLEQELKAAAGENET